MRALAGGYEAMDCLGSDAMVLKSAAMLARYPDVASLHTVADFDILVRRGDATKAVDAMIKAGFRTHPDFPFDLFEAADFKKLHALSFEHKAHGGSVDLHWWPLPRWTHHQFVEELFERSEVGSLAGHFVRIPALADHLYLTLARPEAWEADEVFARAAEAIHILRSCGGTLDWKRVVELCRKFHRGAMAGALPALGRSQVGLASPDPGLAQFRAPPPPRMLP